MFVPGYFIRSDNRFLNWIYVFVMRHNARKDDLQNAMEAVRDLREALENLIHWQDRPCFSTLEAYENGLVIATQQAKAALEKVKGA